MFDHNYTQFAVRSAKSAFSQAGFPTAEASARGEQTVAFILDNIDEFVVEYGTDDLMDLANMVAKDAIKQMNN